MARAVPFVLLAAASLWRAGQAPQGRRSPRFDTTVDWDGLLGGITKWPHITWMAVLFGLAVVAVGTTRLRLGALLTLGVGVGWEIAETTVVGHNARLVDLWPDMMGVLVGWALVVGARALVRNTDRTRRRS